MRYLHIVLGLVLIKFSNAAPLRHSSWETSEWDAIVVGAGPAGIIVADRLSEAGRKTLLIEGGGPSYWITGGRDRPGWLSGANLSRVDVPGLYKSIFADQGTLTCQNVTNAFGGCTIGGSSAVNAGFFFEPPASDFDLYFPKGWKSADVKGAIKKVYDRSTSSAVYSKDDKFYLQSGYNAARQWIVGSAGYKTIEINREANEKSKVFGRPVFSYKDGQRGGPVITYLQTALKRNNFHLQTLTRVKQVLRNGGTATGVLVRDNGTDKTIKLSRNGRVILSGGALQSPQLLWFSGIGDPSMQANLTNGGLTPDVKNWISNPAVGDGLYDNPNTFIELEGPSISSYTHNYSHPPIYDRDLYLKSRSGPYAFASETSAFWDILKHDDGSITGFQGTIDSSGFADYTNNKTITLNVYGTSGLKSRGYVQLDEKTLRPGPSQSVYFSDPRDAEDIAWFIHSIFEKLDSSLLKPLNLPLNYTQNQIRDYITSSTAYTRGQVNHWSSSCRIEECVDTNTVVKGTKNIHVVDGSIIAPLTVNPQFGIMVAAERAIELILRLK